MVHRASTRLFVGNADYQNAEKQARAFVDYLMQRQGTTGIVVLPLAPHANTAVAWVKEYMRLHDTNVIVRPHSLTSVVNQIGIQFHQAPTWEMVQLMQPYAWLLVTDPVYPHPAGIINEIQRRAIRAADYMDDAGKVFQASWS